jgi:hypothetical protein
LSASDLVPGVHKRAGAAIARSLVAPASQKERGKALRARAIVIGESGPEQAREGAAPCFDLRIEHALSQRLAASKLSALLAGTVRVCAGTRLVDHAAGKK